MFIAFRHRSPCVSEMELMDGSIDVSVRIVRTFELSWMCVTYVHVDFMHKHRWTRYGSYMLPGSDVHTARYGECDLP